MHKIVMYSKKNCPVCDVAKQYLRNKNIEYDLRELDKDIFTDTFKAIFPEVKSMPFFLNYDQPFYSFQSLRNHLEKGN